MYTSFSNSTSTASTSISSRANWNGHSDFGNIVEGEGLVLECKYNTYELIAHQLSFIY